MVKRIFIGCGIIVGVILLGALGVTGFLSYRFVTPEKIIQGFHTSLSEGDFDKAYSYLSLNTRSKLSKYEFISKINSLGPFEMGAENSEEIFKKFCRLIEVEIIKANIWDDRANVEIRVTFPAKKTIESLLQRDSHLRMMKEEIDQLGRGLNPDRVLIYNKTGKLMLLALDSLYSQRHEKLLQSYDVKKAKVYLEFELSEWKIKEAI